MNSQDCNNLPNFDFTFNNQQVPGQIFINKNIRITGTVTFSSSVTMRGCKVLMDNDAVIKLIPNSNIFFLASTNNGVGTTFFGCGNRWKAIEIGNLNRILLTRCTIQDSKEGIKLLPGYKSNLSLIRNCLFRRNINGISATNVPVLSFNSFNGNMFTGDVQNDIPTAIGEKIIGINLSGCTGTIGSAGSVNTFTDLTTGISMQENSTISVANCKFNSLFIQGFLSNTFDGIGILSDKSSLTISGSYSFGRSCTFNDNARDILSTRTKVLNVSNADFKNVSDISIQVDKSDSPNEVSITKCHFTKTSDHKLPYRGMIHVQRAAQTLTNHLTIEYDTIWLQPANITGLYSPKLLYFTSASVAGVLDQATIQNNIIQNDHGNPIDDSATSTVFGIFLTGKADGYTINKNLIDYSVPTTRPNRDVIGTGIWMEINKGMSNRITNNTLNSRFFPSFEGLRHSFMRCGLHIDAVPNVFVCNNTSTSCTNDFHFSNDCSGIEFGNNTIGGTCNYGLVATSQTSALPKIHDHKHNQWIGTDFKVSSASFVPSPGGLKWKIDPDANPAYKPPITIGSSSVTPSTWFIQEAEMPNLITPCDQTFLFGEPPTRTGELAKDLLDGKYSFSSTALMSDFELDLLYQMIRYPSSYNANVSANQYYNDRTNTTLWKLSNAIQMLDNAMKISPQEQVNLDQLRLTSSNLQNQIGSIEQNELSATDSLIQLQKISFLEQLNQTAQNIEIATTSIKNSRMPLVTATRTYIDNIATSNDWEQQNKTILSLIGKNCSDQTWTDQELDLLRNIANLCPQVYGVVVNKARSMLPRDEANNYVLEGPDPYCYSSEPRFEDSEMSKLALKIYPNPANDLINIEFGTPFNGKMELFSLNGELVVSKNQKDALRFSINTLNISNGIYTLICTNSNQESEVFRIIINH